MIEHPSPSPEEEREAEADWLLGEGPKADATPAAPPPSRDVPVEGYDIEGGAVVADDEAAPVPPPIAPRPPRKPAPAAAPIVEAQPESTVDEVWSRGAEWGRNLLVVFAVFFGTGLLVYLAAAGGAYKLALFVFACGAAAMVVLSYPMFVTLERPVRVTPEQAAKDYYHALSHLLPHYRRMWLLLSSAGRRSATFDSFEGFRAYWDARLAELRGGRGRLDVPRFEVHDFRSEKSAGLTVVRATFTVDVVFDGSRDAGPVRSFAVKTGLVKGPDRMWYLDQGTLPEVMP